jgi:radical SAM protein with 4Fe4S-binding SPASM domain
MSFVDLVSIKGTGSASKHSALFTGTGGPRSVWLQITSRCNQTCSYCYMNATRNSHDRLSLEQIRFIFDMAKRSGTRVMLISGGEPSIVKELPEILSAAVEEYDFETYLVTNGTGCTPNLVKLLASLDITVQVSMDTIDEVAYAKVRGLPLLPRIMSNIDNMVSSGVKVALSVPITNVVDNKVIDVLEWGIAHGVQTTHVSTSYGQRTGVTESLTRAGVEDVLSQLYRFEKTRFAEMSIDLIESMVIALAGLGEPCSTYCTPMSGRTWEIDAKGEVFYCGAITTVPEFRIGNIFADGFEEQYLRRQRENRHLSFTPDKLTVCSSCEYRSMCKGGCRSQALFYTGDLYGPVSHCEDLKRVYREMVSDFEAGELDPLLDFLKLCYGDNIQSHTKCF